MAAKSNAGWLVLGAALAVPGLIFLYWWTNLNTQSKSELQRRVRRRLAGGQVFGSAPPQEKLRNPIASAAASAAARPGVAGAAPALPAAAPAAAVAASSAAAQVSQPGGLVPQAAAAAPQAAPVPAPAVPGSPAAPAAASQAPSEPATVLKTGAIGQIVLARDPMLSPYDLVRIAEEEERKRQIAEQLKREAWLRAHPHKAARVVRRETDPSTGVELQGIVSTDQGDKAIVNGEMVQEGDLVSVDLDGESAQVKVVKISPTAVLFQYRKKRFIKGISKD